MRILIVSYGRAENVLTASWLSSASIVVPEDQVEEYEYKNPFHEIMGLPKEKDGNIARARNSILDSFPDQKIVMMDDDISYVGYHEKGKRYPATEDHFLEFIHNMFLMTEELGTILWGVNQHNDKKFYRDYSPFSLSAPVLAPLIGIINVDQDIRFNEDVYLKDDYDYFLRVLREYRKVLRNNKWFYVCKHITNKGGLARLRTTALDNEHAKRLQNIWGSRIVKLKRKTQYGHDTLNPIVKSPIKGI